MDKKEFANRLRIVRRIRKLTLQKLSDCTGLNNTLISHYENARRYPTFKNFIALADGLQISTDYLLGRTNTIEIAGVSWNKIVNGLKKLTEKDIDILVNMIEIFTNRDK